MECEGVGRNGECRRVTGEALVGSDGGRGSSPGLLPMSAFIHRQSYSCAGGHLCLQALFSFVGIVFIHGRSPSLVGGRLHLHWWVFAFVRGWLCRWCGCAICMVSWWAFGLFVGHHHHGRSCRWWGAVLGCWWGVVVAGSWCVVVGSWWGVVAGHWCVVVAGPHGHSWWSSHVWRHCCCSIKAPGGTCNRCCFVL